ncbi:unnamed protein product [Chironomus riparius]|uniref:PHD-type domain-containing protein n=1 Tax=Chironomus riparius TaxID=315576 RepID=A0A9N9WL06_9DIPT|nr:unnamed protein product [Chironomus riparius]
MQSSSSYTHQLLRVVVAKICQTVGWQGVTGTALEIMVDILDRYIREICRTTHDYTEHYNRTEGNLDDLELTLRDMGINMHEIIEYISYVDPIITNLEIPKYPVAKDSHFNFLKPGSKEVLTRPVHIHEHLPPINPQEEATYSNGEKDIDVVGLPNDDVFKRPAETDSNPAKKIKLEEEGRATREISSVMMTTSGFISPAREGKLPESKPPKLVEEFPKPIPPPMISPSTFKSKDSPFSVPSSGPTDKKLEKRLKKKNHDKEKKKDKHFKDKYSLPDPNELAQYDPIPPQQSLAPPIIMPREANEHMIMAERKKELKKLKMKNKDEVKKKKEKPPKHPKMQSFDQGFMDSKSTFDPYQVLPTSISQPLATSTQIQAHKYLTGAAHALFPNPILDSFGSQQTPLMSTQNPLIEGKLISEPDKQKLNIFKKISKPKEDPIKHQQQSMQSQMDFLTPSKLDRFDTNQPSTSHPPQTFADPMKKVHKLPKETTLTRVDDSLNMPMNLSGPSRSNDSSFEEMPVPKTPTIPPKTPDFKMSQNVEKKEKKERKKKEKKVNLDQTDWMGGQNLQNQQQHFPNPFDLASQNNSFLQNLQTSSLMGNLANSFMLNRNPFSMPVTDIFSSGPGLIPKAPFSMQQSPLNAMLNPYGMDMNLFQQQQQQQPSPPIKPKKQQSMNTAFDQLLKDQHHQQQQQMSTPAKKIIDEKVETFDLTKDSSPEPTMTAPMPSTSGSTHIITESIPTAITSSFQQENNLPTIPEHSELLPQQPVIKEKSKEKKKKKDKDRDKERDKDKEERKKKKKEKKKKKDKHKDKEKHRASMSTLDSQSNDTEDTADNNSTSSVPKLMLKLNSPRPNTPDTHKKTIIQRSRNEDFEFPSPHQDTSHRGLSPHLSGYARDPSPELARISPLVTRPPKIKHTTSIYSSTTTSGDYYHQQQQSNYMNQYDYNNPQYMDYQQSSPYSSYSSQYQTNYQQPLQQQQTHYQTPNYQQPTEYPTQNVQYQQQTYQQPQDLGYSNNNNDNNNQSWNITQNKASYIDADGSTVWICPACGSIDDGSPMIGCDACDAWYHWACVGIKVEPNENEDWFCRACISRKQSDQLEGKKKKRKKKDRESKNL